MVWEEWEGYGGSRLGDLALLASLKHILIVLSFTVVHIRDVYAIEALASKLVDSPKVLQVLSNRFQELILRMTTSVRGRDADRIAYLGKLHPHLAHDHSIQAFFLLVVLKSQNSTPRKARCG